MQKHSTILSSLLVEKGNEVTVVHCGGKDYSADSFTKLYPANGEVEEVYIPFPKTDSLPGHYIRENKLYSKHIYTKLKDRLDDFDIIYSQGFTAWHLLKEKRKGTFQTNILVNFHGFEMFQKAPSLKMIPALLMLRPFVKKCLLDADYVYDFGGKISGLLLKLKIPKSKLLLHSNGIPEDWIIESKDKSKDRNFVFIGRNERRKGIEELNQAIKLLGSEIDYHISFIGPIPESNQIDSAKVSYLGEIRDSEEIKEVLDRSSCLICPSHSEGMPTVILEAMARGLAIIATDVGAVSRMLEENGYLLEGPDPALIKDSMIRIINLSDEELLKMQEKSIDLIREQFTWDVIAEQKIRDFEKIIAS